MDPEPRGSPGRGAEETQEETGAEGWLKLEGDMKLEVGRPSLSVVFVFVEGPRMGEVPHAAAFQK